MGSCRLRICGESILVPHHQHKLHLDSSQETYTCNGCKELGYGKRYRCLDGACPNFRLHKECGQPEIGQARHSSFFKEIQFTFHSQSPKLVKSCVACGKNVTGYSWWKGELGAEAKGPFDCLMCKRKKISQKIEGWAYVSACDNYCYYVGCVLELIAKKHEQAGNGTNFLLEVSQLALRVGGEMMVMALRLIIIPAVSGGITF